MWLGTVSGMALALGVTPATAQQAPAQHPYNIAAQSLASALVEFSRQGDVVVTAQAHLTHGRASHAVRGTYTADQVLKLLLAGSGLSFQISPSGAYVITQAPRGERNTGRGSISGQVLDPATGDYKRDAIIRIATADGKRQEITSGDGGAFEIADIPAGPAEITVEFTGYPDQSRTVDVVAGKVARVDVLLFQPGENAKHEDIVVTGVREGDARAIMSQRRSMNITNSLSSESFGEISNGNIGEFLKFMPGVSTQNQGGADDTVRYVGLRGLPPQYTSVTINGISVAGADANDGATSSRSFSFEQASLSSIDSIEISKTVSADVDANAPAGTINLRTKRAFDRKGRRIVVSLDTTTQSDLWDNQRAGPTEKRGNGRFRPGGSIEYSDVFLGGRLGILASASLSRTHTEMETIQNGWNYVPTAISPNPLASATLLGRVTAQEITRISSNATIDFKASDSLTLSLMSLYNHSYNLSDQRNFTFTSGARARGLTGNPAFDFTTQQAATTNTVSVGSNTIAKTGTGLTLVPSFEFHRSRVVLDGDFFYTTSRSSYDPLGKEGAVFGLANAPTSRGNFSAERSTSYLAADWAVHQVSGPDWSDPSSYSVSSIVLNTQDGRSARVERLGGALNLSVDVPVGAASVTLKAGAKIQNNSYDYENQRKAYLYQYAGPLSSAQFLSQIRSSTPLTFNDSGFGYSAISGSPNLYMPSNYLLGQYFREHPGEFVHTMTATNYYNAFIANTRHFEENTNAAYAMATSKLTDWLTVRAGVRWEGTKTRSLEPDPLSASVVAAAGYAVSASTGQATTVDGIKYQYESRPRTARKGRYDYFFPSASAKLSVFRNTDLQFGYSRTIRRPEVSVLAGVWSANETSQIVTVPNPGLTPEMSNNYSVRLAQYFEPVGLVAVNYFRNDLKGAFQAQLLTAEEFGYTGSQYAGYQFQTTTTVGDGTISIQGVELELNYSLERLLPSPFKGLTLRGSYTYTKPNQPISLTARNMVTLALAYRKGPARLYLNTVWTDDRPGTISSGTYDRARWDVNLSGSYRIRRGIEAYFAIRNLLNLPVYRMAPGVANSVGSAPDHAANWNNAGISSTIGLRATF
jgi:TonB-dependent receptor